MKKIKFYSLLITICILLLCNGHTFSQENSSFKTSSIDKSIIEYDISKIDSYEQRTYVLYHLYTNPRLEISISEDNGIFLINQSNCNDYKISNIREYLNDFYQDIVKDYEKISKDSAAYLYHEYKRLIPPEYTTHLMMDYYAKSSMNNFCSTALPFCTDNGAYNFPAGVNAGTGEYGPSYNCLSTTPNPAWYYMKIKDPGAINIYMYSTPAVDIDFCCWGPFSDPIAPCPYGLTTNKVVSCSYSGAATETCKIPSSARTGEYYILLITNYSNRSCNIHFEKQSGSGTTDCSIMPPLIDSNSPVCIGETLYLTAQETYNATYFWTGPNGWTSNLRSPSRSNVTPEMQGTYYCSITVGSQTSDAMTTEVVVDAPENTLIIDTICQTDDYLSYNFNLENLSAGNYQSTLSLNTVYGCDSIVTLNLTVNPTYDSLIIDTICQWDSYLQNGFVFDSMPAGNYFDTLFLNTIYGCDSIVKLNLTVNPIYDTLFIDTICQGDSYLQNGFVFDSVPAGNYFDTLFLNTIYGCDSIVKLNLTVNPTYDSLIIDTICQWDSYLQNGFVFDSMPAGNYFDTLFLNTIYGCDSIVKLNLTVNPTYDSLIIDTICQWDSYLQNGFVFDSMPAGNYFDTLFLNTIHGCDSIIKLNLTVNPTYDTLIIDTIYMGESYIENNFAFDSMPIGNYFDTLFFNTILGCDSIVKLSLTVGMDYDTIIFDTICQGDNYTENNFFILNAGIGSHYDSLFFSTIYGFDSIVKLNLFVGPSFDTLIIDTICYGDNYLENNFNVLTPPSGLYQDSIFLNTIHGCDSIVRLNLTVNPSYDIEINENICHGEDYIDNGFVFEDMTPGNYFDTLFLNTINGCDSIVRLNLIVNPTYDIEINDVACQGDDYLENGFVIESLPVGTYSETLFLNSIHGCDSVVKLNLTVNETFHFEINDSICYGEDYMLYGLNLTQPNVGIDNYTSNLQTINGCDSIFNVTLKVLELYDEIEIVGEELLLVSTNLTTGCYLYTVGENEEDRTYSWKIDNGDWKIAPNNNECLVWATTPEKCTLTVSGGNSCGTVTDVIELTADFFDEVNNSKVMMYPNPAKNHLNIKHNDISRINVYDSYGQLILRNDYNLDNQVMLDLNSLESSIYIIEIITPEQTFIERISIIK